MGCAFRLSRLITLDVPFCLFPCTTISFTADSDDLIVEVTNPLVKDKCAEKEENSAVKMQRLAEEKRFQIKEAMAQRGGSEAFLRWLRTGDGKKA
jgi:hypothetical protein